MLPPDIEARIRHDYGQQATDALQLLSKIEGPDASRIIRCVLYLSQGDFKKMNEYKDAAEVDARDVICWAECSKDGEQLRDLGKPF